MGHPETPFRRDDLFGVELVVAVREKGGQHALHRFAAPAITIGRDARNDIVLPKGNVSRRHVRVVKREGRVYVEDLESTCGFYVNGERLGDVVEVRPSDTIEVGDFSLQIAAGLGPSAAGDAS